MRPYAFKKTKWRLLASIGDSIGFLFRRPPPSLALTPKRVLIVRLDQMGDIILTLPVFKSLRDSFPGVQIDCLTTPLGVELLSYANAADRYISWNCPWFDRRRKSEDSLADVRDEIRSGHYDCALELRGDVRLIRLLRDSRIGALVGYGATGGGFLLDVNVPWRSQAHAIDKNLALVEAIGGRVSDRQPSLPEAQGPPAQRSLVPRPPAPRPSGALRLAVHADAGTPAKRWPLARYAELIERLHAALDAEIVLVGLDERLGAALVDGTGDYVTNLMGKTMLRQLAEQLKECDGLVSNDSGPAHLMAALGRPVWVVWSGTAAPLMWAPRGPRVRIFERSVPCAPCSLAVCKFPDHPCLTGISVDSVLNAIVADLRPSFAAADQ